MYDATFELTRREAAMDAEEALDNITTPAPVILPRWVVQAMANLARDLPHVLPLVIPDTAVTAHGRPGAVKVLQQILTPYEEAMWHF